MAFLLDGKPLAVDVPFTYGDIHYPANWLRLSTADEKTALGITEVADSPTFDSRFYNGDGSAKSLTDTTETIQEIADTKYEGDIIKATREVNFATETYPTLSAEYGEETVATTVIDSSGLQKQKDLDRFVKQNPALARQVVYDVATGKAMKFVKNTVTNKFELIPASSADVEDTGDIQPAPRDNPGLFGQPTKPGKELKEILPDFRDTGVDEDFYQ